MIRGQHGTADIGHTVTARAAGCGHWLTVGARYLVLSSGKSLCALCGLAWCTSAAERRALLSSAVPSGAA